MLLKSPAVLTEGKTCRCDKCYRCNICTLGGCDFMVRNLGWDCMCLYPYVHRLPLLFILE